MFTVTRPLSPDPERFLAYARLAFDERRFTNNGPLLNLLELRLRELLGARYLCLVANATVGLHIALRALDVKGEVITTPYTFAATTHAIHWAGCRPVFVDIEPEFLTIDPAAIERAITPETSAILGVHVYGHPCRVREIEEIAKRHRLAVVYDAAHAFNVSAEGRSIGAWGDASVYSFHATKLFHTSEGGAVETTREDIARRLERLRNFGIESEGSIVDAGTNGKLGEISAALGLAVLEIYGEEMVKREVVRNRYAERLSGRDDLQIVYPQRLAATRSNVYFAIRVAGDDRRDGLHAYLHGQGILSRRYFAPLTSHIPLYTGCRGADSVPIAAKVASEVLALPFYGDLTADDVDFICDRVLEFLASE